MKSKIILFNEEMQGVRQDGIFNNLQEQANSSDIHEKGIISVSTNYPYKYSIPSYLYDKGVTYWASNKSIDAYLLIDFKKNKVIVNDYLINDRGHDFPQEWKMLGSNDKRRWTLISHEKSNYANNDGNLYWLRYHSLSLGRFRYIKIIQLQSRTLSDGPFLVFYGLELFGVFCSEKDINNDMISCRIRRSSQFSFKYTCIMVLIS